MANPPADGPRHGQSTHSRSSSMTPSWSGQQHAPATPSGLRNSHVVSDSDENLRDRKDAEEQSSDDSQHMPQFHADGIIPALDAQADIASDEEDTHVEGYTAAGPAPDLRTRLLDQQHGGSPKGYGTANRRPPARSGSPATFTSMDSVNSTIGFAARLLPSSLRNRLMTTDDPLHQQELDITTVLARRHGVTDRRKMYLMYYFPFTNWIRQYRWTYVKGDLISAFTMASFYLPMSLSYASNLAHIPPINGLYSFVFNPLIYAFLGTCPQMVVGPEAAGSLLTGQVVRENIKSGKHGDDDDFKHAQVAGMVTGLAGAVILLAGLCRLGFLDSVLSRPFLRGFISAIGIVILVDQLIPEMGLQARADGSGTAHGSSLDKIMFLFEHVKEAHGLTCAVSFGAFGIAMICRELKKRLQPRRPWVAYVPDRFTIVVLSAVFAWAFKWEEKGLDILGDIRAKGKPFQAEFPFQPSMLEHATDAFSTGILIALLGFFESSVAAKSLGAAPKRGQANKDGNAEGNDDDPGGITSMMVSPNRELVALGVANIVGGIFMALPAFGGYGRSKVNASTGGKTPMSSAFLSLITILCILCLLPYFYYIPKGVLSAMISVVAYSLIEEAPHDLFFFWRISGYAELFLMLIIFLTTFFWNLRIGIFVGIAISLLRLLRHSTRPRIQILGRVPGTKNHFENAELCGLMQADDGSVHEDLEFIENTLIIKIPEPLTFANTGSLKDRLRRVEDHGADGAHPALPRLRRPDADKTVVFDVHGVTGLDPAAAQVLLEIVAGYRDRGVRIYFARLQRTVMGRGATEPWRLMQVSGIVDVCGGEGRFVGSVQEALDRAEAEARGAVGGGPGGGPVGGGGGGGPVSLTFNPFYTG